MTTGVITMVGLLTTALTTIMELVAGACNNQSLISLKENAGKTTFRQADQTGQELPGVLPEEVVLATDRVAEVLVNR